METFDAAALSDRGKKRATNEDNVFLDIQRGIFLVADGMGGESYGEVASRLTVDGFSEMILNFKKDQEMTIPFEYPEGEDVFIHMMRHAVEGANSLVVAFAEERRSHRGMGSTLTAVVFYDGGFYVAHVGDSRLYRYRDQTLMQITEDHTKVHEMVKEGIISSEDARKHPQRHVITRCIGRKKRSQPDVFRMDMENDDDVFLLCTDGLTDMLADDEIQDILGGDRDLTSITEELVKKSNERGGVDNITVLVFSHHKSSV